METELSEAPCTDITKSDGKASGEETESNEASRPDDSKCDPHSTTSIQEKRHSKESITPPSKVLTHSSTGSLSTQAERSSSGGYVSATTRKPLSTKWVSF